MNRDHPSDRVGPGCPPPPANPYPTTKRTTTNQGPGCPKRHGDRGIVGQPRPRRSTKDRVGLPIRPMTDREWAHILTSYGIPDQPSSFLRWCDRCKRRCRWRPCSCPLLERSQGRPRMLAATGKGRLKRGKRETRACFGCPPASRSSRLRSTPASGGTLRYSLGSYQPVSPGGQADAQRGQPGGDRPPSWRSCPSQPVTLGCPVTGLGVAATTVKVPETPRFPPPQRPVTSYVPGPVVAGSVAVTENLPLASACAVIAPTPANSPRPLKAGEMSVTPPGTWHPGWPFARTSPLTVTWPPTATVDGDTLIVAAKAGADQVKMSVTTAASGTKFSQASSLTSVSAGGPVPPPGQGADLS
jgi:hypothetical protein